MTTPSRTLPICRGRQISPLEQVLSRWSSLLSYSIYGFRVHWVFAKESQRNSTRVNHRKEELYKESTRTQIKTRKLLETWENATNSWLGLVLNKVCWDDGLCLFFHNRKANSDQTVLDPRLLLNLNRNIPQKSTFTHMRFREVASIDGVLNSIYLNLLVSSFFFFFFFSPCLRVQSND